MGKRLVKALMFVFILSLFGCNGGKETSSKKDVTTKKEATTTVHTHELEKFERVESSCIKEGNVEYYKCESCGKMFADASASTEIFDIIIPVKEHKYEVIEVVSTTCTSDGYDILKCSVCNSDNSIKYDNFVYSNGHTFDESKTVTVEATCVEPGYVSKTCSVCNEVIRTGYTESLGHIKDNGFTPIVKEATCLEGGSTTLKCLVCKEEYEIDKIEPLGHLYLDEDTVRKDATCDSPQTIEKHCSRCDYSEFSIVSDSLGHKFNNGICERCEKDVYDINIITVYNKWDESPVKVMKNEDGSYEIYSESSYSSDKNGTDDKFAVIMVRNEVLAELARRGIGSLVFTPGCSDENARAFAWQIDDVNFNAVNVGGNEFSSLSFAKPFYDGESFFGMIDQEGNMKFLMIHGRMGDDKGYLESFSLKVGFSCLTHTKKEGESTITNATCTEDGFTTNVCSVCGCTYISDVVKALGHDFETIESYDSATCEHIKGDIQVCKVCHDRKEEIVEAKKKHYFVSGTCTNCNKTIEEASLISVLDSNDLPVSVTKAGFNYTINAKADDGETNTIIVDKDYLTSLYEAGYTYLTFGFSKITDSEARYVYVTDGYTVHDFNLFVGGDCQTQFSWYVIEFATKDGIKDKYSNGVEISLSLKRLQNAIENGINCRIQPAKKGELVSFNTMTTETRSENSVTFYGGFTGYYNFGIGVSEFANKTNVKITIKCENEGDNFQIVSPISGNGSSLGPVLTVNYPIDVDVFDGMLLFGFYFNHSNLPTDAVFTISYIVE